MIKLIGSDKHGAAARKRTRAGIQHHPLFSYCVITIATSIRTLKRKMKISNKHHVASLLDMTGRGEESHLTNLQHGHRQQPDTPSPRTRCWPRCSTHCRAPATEPGTESPSRDFWFLLCSYHVVFLTSLINGLAQWTFLSFACFHPLSQPARYAYGTKEDFSLPPEQIR